MYQNFHYKWIQFANILLKIMASKFMKDTDLQNLLPDFAIKVILAS